MWTPRPLQIRALLTYCQIAVYYLPGTLVGALWGGWLGDRYGRITTIGFASVWAIIGASLQCSAQNASWMFCGEHEHRQRQKDRKLTRREARVFNGIGTGILNAITPVWATETASHTSRGAFGRFEHTNTTLSLVLMGSSLDRVYIEHLRCRRRILDRIVGCSSDASLGHGLTIDVYSGTSFYGDGTSGFIWRLVSSHSWMDCSCR